MKSAYEPSTEAFLNAYRAAGIPRVSSGTPEAARERLAAMRMPRADAPQMARVEEALVQGGSAAIPVRIYEPRTICLATVVYLHGGGWVVGNLDTSDFAVRHFALKTGTRVVSVDYRLAPEHPFPAAADDADTALCWAAELAERTEPSRHPLFVAGDSAGANLAAVACLRARGRGSPRIEGQILIYPIVDCDFTTASYAAAEFTEPMCSDDMRWFWSLYDPEGDRRSHPDASPLRAELYGLPPAFIATAEHDPLRDEGEAYAAKLRRAGVDVRHEHYPGTLHGFFSMPDIIAPAQTLLADCADFIASLSAPSGRFEGQRGRG